MKFSNFFLFICFCHYIQAQSGFVGSYQGVFNGDQVTLTLIGGANNKLTGKMQDSQNIYDVSGLASKNIFTGQAVEKNIGITFDLSGALEGDKLNMILSFEFLGEKQNMDVVFNKIKTSDTKTNTFKSNVVSSKTRDAKVVGTWIKESNYSSGYSSMGSYGAMNTRESMMFFADGSMSDGGSTTVVGGDNFSGSSSGGGKGIIPGLYWWTENNKIFLNISENGKSQDLELGKYYIENGRMLITASNGEKMLLTKQ
jgi:hypothetical protein